MNERIFLVLSQLRDSHQRAKSFFDEKFPLDPNLVSPSNAQFLSELARGVATGSVLAGYLAVERTSILEKMTRVCTHLFKIIETRKFSKAEFNEFFEEFRTLFLCLQRVQLLHKEMLITVAFTGHFLRSFSEDRLDVMALWTQTSSRLKAIIEIECVNYHSVFFPLGELEKHKFSYPLSSALEPEEVAIICTGCVALKPEDAIVQPLVDEMLEDLVGIQERKRVDQEIQGYISGLFADSSSVLEEIEEESGSTATNELFEEGEGLLTRAFIILALVMLSVMFTSNLVVRLHFQALVDQQKSVFTRAFNAIQSWFQFLPSEYQNIFHGFKAIQMALRQITPGLGVDKGSFFIFMTTVTYGGDLISDLLQDFYSLKGDYSENLIKNFLALQQLRLMEIKSALQEGPVWTNLHELLCKVSVKPGPGSVWTQMRQEAINWTPTTSSLLPNFRMLWEGQIEHLSVQGQANLDSLFRVTSLSGSLVLFAELILSHGRVLNGLTELGLTAEMLSVAFFLSYLGLGEVVTLSRHKLLRSMTKLARENKDEFKNKGLSHLSDALIRQEDNQLGVVPVMNHDRFVPYTSTAWEWSNETVKEGNRSVVTQRSVKKSIAVQGEIYDGMYATWHERLMQMFKEIMLVGFNAQMGMPATRLLHPHRIWWVLRKLNKEKRKSWILENRGLAALHLVLLYTQRLALALSMVVATGVVVVRVSGTSLAAKGAGDIFESSHTGTQMSILAGAAALHIMSLAFRTNGMNLLSLKTEYVTYFLLGASVFNTVDLLFVQSLVGLIFNNPLVSISRTVHAFYPYRAPRAPASESTDQFPEDLGLAPPDLLSTDKYVDLFSEQVGMVHQDSKPRDRAGFIEPQRFSAPFPIVHGSVGGKLVRRTLPMQLINMFHEFFDDGLHKAFDNEPDSSRRGELITKFYLDMPGEVVKMRFEDSGPVSFPASYNNYWRPASGDKSRTNGDQVLPPVPRIVGLGDFERK